VVSGTSRLPSINDATLTFCIQSTQLISSVFGYTALILTKNIDKNSGGGGLQKSVSEFGTQLSILNYYEIMFNRYD
jgi:hypothetical protein